MDFCNKFNFINKISTIKFYSLSSNLLLFFIGSIFIGSFSLIDVLLELSLSASENKEQ